MFRFALGPKMTPEGLMKNRLAFSAWIVPLMLDGDPPITRLMMFETPPGLTNAAVFPAPTENWLKL